jgi:hypothetical protein
MSDEVIKIAVLEQKLVEFSNIVGKIDNAIEKISEVNTNIIRMLAVHDERIEQCNRSDDLLIKMIDDLKLDNNKDHKVVVSRISDMEKKVDELSKFRWVVGGIGVLAVIMASTVTTLASGWLSPFEIQYNQNNQSIQK